MLAASRTKAFPWKGNGPSCEIRLPVPFGVSSGLFSTCPPKRVLILGDSVSLTMGIQMSLDQEDWGTLVDIAAINGCGFVTGDYYVQFEGAPAHLNPQCNNEVATWTSDVRSFGPQAIVVELGWWDSFVHVRVLSDEALFLTQPEYDLLVEKQILGLIQSLRAVSTAPIYFLSVPWMRPSALPNGQPEVAASKGFHHEINRLIWTATRSSTTTHFVDISPYISPAGHFQADVDGGVCRESDGIHLYYGSFSNYVHTACGEALQRGVLSMIRRDLAKP